MKLYHRPDCPFCWKVNVYLSEIGVETERTTVELGKKHPDVVKLNPNATVPVLISEDIVMFESAIIIEYLADKYPEKSLFEGSPEQIAKIRQLHLFSDSKVGKILFPYIKKVREGASPQEIIEHKESITEDWQNLQQYLSDQLGDMDYFGNEFSVADCALIPRLTLALAYGLEISSEYSNLKSWMRRIVERPSFVAAKPENFQIIDDMIKMVKEKY